jgi:hypothetical protein
MRKPSPRLIVITIVALLALGMLAGWYFLLRTEARVARITGGDAAAVLFGSDDWELVSLYPYADAPGTPMDSPSLNLKARPVFGYFHELGRAKLSATEVDELRDALTVAILDADPTEICGCLWPRHGLSIKYEGKQIQFFLSFQCRRVTAFLNEPAHFQVSASALGSFNRVLSAHALETDNLPPGIHATTVGVADLRRLVGPDLVAAIENAESMELLSLYPHLLEEAEEATRESLALATREDFGTFKVLGRVRLRPQDIATIRTALLEGMVEGARDGASMLCFLPRHGLVITHGGREYALTICFECRQVDVHPPHKDGFLISKSPTETFNRMLDAHGLMKSPK